MMAVWVVVVVLGVGAAAVAVASRRHSDDVEPTVREFAEFRDAIVPAGRRGPDRHPRHAAATSTASPSDRTGVGRRLDDEPAANTGRRATAPAGLGCPARSARRKGTRCPRSAPPRSS